jgi:hypothetical protein
MGFTHRFFCGINPMSLRGTKQSHAIQGRHTSVRLPRYARNDMGFNTNRSSVYSSTNTILN